MNWALLAKVGWRLMSNTDSLWASVLRCKYRVGTVQDSSWVVPKSTWSSTWRSIGVGLREVVANGVGWVPGDGRTIRFWSDRWLLREPLVGQALLPVAARDVGKRLEEYWTLGDGWDMTTLSQYLPQHILQRLHAIVIKGIPCMGDRVSWQGTADGEFSVWSAYAMITQEVSERPCMEKFFKRVWRVVAPERVRVFLWLVTHQFIMTDMERKRRHMGENSVCQVCNGAEESIIHVLRDCPAMEGIWLRLVPLKERHAFFGMTLLEWLFANLKSESKYGCEIWATLFSMSVWWAWKWRCGNVFGERGKCRDRVRFLKEMVVEVTNAHAKEGGHIQRGGWEIMVSWRKPEEDWVALNTDGASRCNPGLAKAGGLLEVRMAIGELVLR